MVVILAGNKADYWFDNILNNGEFFADTVDKPTEGAEQQRKRQFLKDIISKVKVVGCKKPIDTGKSW